MLWHNSITNNVLLLLWVHLVCRSGFKLSNKFLCTNGTLFMLLVLEQFNC